LRIIMTYTIFLRWQANLSNAENPNPHLEYLINAFWNYIAQAAHPTDKTSHLNWDIKSSKYNLPPLLFLMTKITKEAEVLRERLEKDLNTIRDKLEPYADNLKSQIQQRVEELRTAMAPYADSLDSETLKATLLQKSEELRGNLEQSVKELQAQLEPYTAEIKDNVDQYLQEIYLLDLRLKDKCKAKASRNRNKVLSDVSDLIRACKTSFIICCFIRSNVQTWGLST
uniref:Uncharacterized protein n=1 Tax=Sinocyclocheilus anshuiensis TaxID=1608454 RepID=A0A671LWZ1_9TELE